MWLRGQVNHREYVMKRKSGTESASWGRCRKWHSCSLVKVLGFLFHWDDEENNLPCFLYCLWSPITVALPLPITWISGIDWLHPVSKFIDAFGSMTVEQRWRDKAMEWVRREEDIALFFCFFFYFWAFFFFFGESQVQETFHQLFY